MWNHPGDQGVLDHPRDQGVLQPETPGGGSQLPTLQEHLMESLPHRARNGFLAILASGGVTQEKRMDDLILIFCVRGASGWLELSHAGVLG